MGAAQVSRVSHTPPAFNNTQVLSLDLGKQGEIILLVLGGWKPPPERDKSPPLDS